MLESQLAEVDKQETSGISLGTFRRDRNDERKRLLASLDVALAQYGKRGVMQDLVASRFHKNIVDDS